MKRFSSLYTGRKETLSEDDLQRLLSNDFIVEEKLDGSLHVREFEGVYLMLEDMRYVHTVFYDRLPARFILVDVCTEDGMRLSYDEREEYSLKTGIPLPPTICWAYRSKSPLRDDFLDLLTPLPTSKFGSEQAEGFVIKSEVFMDLGGKHSRFELDGAERYNRSRKNQIQGPLVKPGKTAGF